MMLRSRLAVCAAASLLVSACQAVPPESDPPVSSNADAIQGAATPAPPPIPATPLTPAAPLPPAPATPAQPATPKPPKLSYSSVEGVGKVVALTFDDGPHPKLTPKLLDMLKAQGVKATFFLVGQNAAEYPDIIRRMEAEGHEVANHSWSHPAFTRLGAEGVRSQIERTNAAIEKAVGHPPKLIRPPYGATSARLNRYYADTFGMTAVMWSVDPLDWKYRNSARVTQKILEGAAAGAIILVHDIHPTSVDAIPAVIAGLKAKGYKFATVSELIAMEGQAAPKAAPEATPAPASPAPTPAAEFEVERYEFPQN